MAVKRIGSKGQRAVRSKHKQPVVRLASADDGPEGGRSLHKTAQAILAVPRSAAKPRTAHENAMVRAAQGTVALRTAARKRKQQRNRSKQSRKRNR